MKKIYFDKIMQTSIMFQTEYFNSKNLQGLNLGIDPKFSAKIEINKSSSVVHIPTDVYSGGELISGLICITPGACIPSTDQGGCTKGTLEDFV